MKRNDINQLEIEEVSIKNIYFSVIESLLFVSGEPLRIKDISSIIECSDKFTEDLLKDLILKYENEDRGIKLIKVNDTYGLVTKPQNSQYIQKLLKTNTRQSLSQAALETLAIIAYKQPITRIDIDEIRGVKSDRAIASLQEKKLIKECGRLEVPGRPILYATGEEFLKYFGLEKLEELPKIDELVEKYVDDKEENKEY